MPTAAEALNKLADYFEQCAGNLEPWRKNSMQGRKVIDAQIRIWMDARDAAISKAEAAS